MAGSTDVEVPIATDTAQARKSILRMVLRRRTEYSATALSIGVIVVLVAIWQVFSSTRIIDPFFISSPWLVIQQVGSFIAHGVNSLGQQGALYVSLWPNIWVTLYEAILGFALGSAVGVIVGLILSQSRVVALALVPILNMINTLPRVALAPLFILWFGLGLASKVFLVFTVVVFIMIFNTYSGAKSVDTELISALRLLGAQRFGLVRKLVFPSSLPWIFAGMRIAMAWSIGSAVIGEYLGANIGMGYVIFNFANALDNTGLLAGCVVLLFMSFVLFALVSLLERLVVRPRTGRTVK